MAGITEFSQGITTQGGGFALDPKTGLFYYMSQFHDTIGQFNPATGTSIEIKLPPGTGPYGARIDMNGNLWWTGVLSGNPATGNRGVMNTKTFQLTVLPTDARDNHDMKWLRRTSRSWGGPRIPPA